MKRKSINKLLSTVMVAAMSAGLLAGCGGSASTDTAATTPAADSTATTESSSTGDSAATTTDSGDKVTINVTRATFNLANPDTEQVKKVQDAVNEYIGDKINVQVNLTDIGSGEYTDKANLALANNEINLLWTASWESVIGTNDLVPQKAVYDLTDLIQGTDVYNSMDEGQWEATKYDGKIYFIPVYKDNVEGYDWLVRNWLTSMDGIYLQLRL